LQRYKVAYYVFNLWKTEVRGDCLQDCQEGLAGGESLVRVEGPFLTAAIKETHLLPCQALLNNLKKGKACRVIIYSKQKSIVNPMQNCQNDR